MFVYVFLVFLQGSREYRDHRVHLQRQETRRVIRLLDQVPLSRSPPRSDFSDLGRRPTGRSRDSHSLHSTTESRQKERLEAERNRELANLQAELASLTTELRQTKAELASSQEVATQLNSEKEENTLAASANITNLKQELSLVNSKLKTADQLKMLSEQTAQEVKTSAESLKQDLGITSSRLKAARKLLLNKTKRLQELASDYSATQTLLAGAQDQVSYPIFQTFDLLLTDVPAE